MTNERKGKSFEFFICSKMLLAGYYIAIPIPDEGEDLWVRDAENPLSIARIQLKASFSPKPLKKKKYKEKYAFNIRENNYFANRDQKNFFYIFGLYSRCGRNWDNSYHIDYACIPAIELERFRKMGMLGIGSKNNPKLTNNGETRITVYIYLNEMRNFSSIGTDIRKATDIRKYLNNFDIMGDYFG